MKPEGARLSASRRLVLAALAALGAGIPLLGARRARRPGAERWLARLSTEIPGGAFLGRRYLRAHPEEASAAWLAARLFGTGGGHDAKLDHVRTLVAQGRASDFRTGHLVAVEGWLIARTEARLLALLALHQV
jgi:hypothetical protein